MKKEFTYTELHNKAVTLYHKMMMSFLFIALLNFIGAIMGTVRGDTSYFPCLVSNTLLFSLVSNYIENIILLTIVNSAISLAFSAIFIVIWWMTKTGKIKAIIVGSAFYLIDVILLFVFYFHDSYLIPQLLLHILMMVFIVVGILNYYHIFEIERKFKK